MIEDMRIMLTVRLDMVRINATIVRLQEIITKLNSRIEKIAAAGASVTVAQGDSASATAALTVSTTDMTNVKALVASIASTTPTSLGLTGTATSTIKADMMDAQMQIQTAQKDIEDAVASLMGMTSTGTSTTSVQ
jgi:vacuolar-type H+-ATPase subunit D/Vma8